MVCATLAQTMILSYTSTMNKAAASLAKLRWAKRDVEKVCLFCGRTFRGVPEQLYCTPKHQNAAAAQRQREKHRAAPSSPPIADPPPAPLPIDERKAVMVANLLDQAERVRARGETERAEQIERMAAGIATSAEATP